jgi:transposase-like protein
VWLSSAVDSGGQMVDFDLSETRNREAAKTFLRRALANPDNRLPRVFARDGLRSYPAANSRTAGRRPTAPPLSVTHATIL